MRRILIFEGNPLSASLVEEYLTSVGWMVFHAMDVKHVLETAGTCQPQVIVLSLGFPVEPVLAVLRALKQNPDLQLIPVVVISAVATRRQQTQALAAGATDYLLKPFTFEQLALTLEQCL